MDKIHCGEQHKSNLGGYQFKLDVRIGHCMISFDPKSWISIGVVYDDVESLALDCDS